MRLILLLFFAWSAMPALAASLDLRDQGGYVLLNQHNEPTVVQMRFFQRNQQWMMDGRQEEDGCWQPVCRADGACRLQHSLPDDIEYWKQHLPPEWHKQTFRCINNAVLAFCRTQDLYTPQRRVYWFFALPENEEVYPLVLQPLRVS